MMLNRFRRSTSGLVTLVALLLGMATAVIGTVAYEVTHEALEQQLDHRIEAEMRSLIAESRGTMPGLTAAIERRSAAHSTSSLDYILLDREGNAIAATIVTDHPAAPGYEEFLHYRRGEAVGVAQALTTSLGAGTLIVAADRSGLDEIDRTLMQLFAGALAVTLLMGSVSALLVGWITRRRLARIDATAKAIIAGDFTRRVPVDGSGSEFDRLARTINSMLERINTLLDNLRQVSSDVAHDLRTPLTRLYNRLGDALSGHEAEPQRAAIEAARSEAAELLEIFAALLRIAEIEGMQDRSRRQPVDLTALVEQMGETYAPDFEASGHRFEVDAGPGAVIHGDQRLLSQAVANLLDNALRHTPAGTLVRLVGETDGRTASITVRDDGPGAAVADPSTLFRRFVRVEHARASPGNGLGLALVAAIISAMGGNARIDSGSGFAVILTFPTVEVGLKPA